jgi:hypothetical protein
MTGLRLTRTLRETMVSVRLTIEVKKDEAFEESSDKMLMGPAPGLNRRGMSSGRDLPSIARNEEAETTKRQKTMTRHGK